MKSFLRYTALLLSWLPSLVSADTCTANAPTPASYTVLLKNSAADTPISDWLMLAEQHWTCVKTEHDNEDEEADNIFAGQKVEVQVQDATIISNTMITHEGKLYRRYKVRQFFNSLEKQGYAEIAFIARWRNSIGGRPTQNWQPVQKPPLEIDGSGTPDEAQMNVGDTYLVTAQVEVKLFSTSLLRLPISNQVFNMTILRAGLANNSAAPTSSTLPQAWNLRVNFPYKANACTTPDVNVTLPPVGENLFPSIGSTGPATAFEMRFENCSILLNKVDYKFQAVPHQTISNGVLPVSNGRQPLHPDDYETICNADYSSCGYDVAFGYGVQILDGNQPLVFDVWRNLEKIYEQFTPTHTYTVPLGARIIRTHQHTQPGLIRVYMNMSVRYQ